MLPDVFCSECQESRDINLCYIPPRPADSDGILDKQWVCEDCGVPYNASIIEGRLIQILRKKMVRYALQDVRCMKTNRIATRVLSSFSSDCSTTLKLDISPQSSIQELQLLRNLAIYHDLELLQETVESVLTSYR
jgi:DNA polymerase epsilon subunit 1